MEKGQGLFSMMSDEKKRHIGRIFYEAIMEEKRREAMEKKDLAKPTHERGADELYIYKNH